MTKSSWMAGLLGVVFSWASLGCVSASSAGYQHAGVRIVEVPDGQSPVVLVEECFTIPLLLGSRFEDEYPVEDNVIILVSGTRDDITVSVTGTNSNSSTTLDALELGEGNTPVLTVNSDDGGEIEVFVRGGCY